MGENIKTLSKGKVFNSDFEIEFNHPPSDGQDEQIHIQSDVFRLEMDKRDYLKYALSVMVAEKNLRIIKKIK